MAVVAILSSVLMKKISSVGLAAHATEAIELLIELLDLTCPFHPVFYDVS